MQQALEPASSIIELFGGTAAVQAITGASRTRVYRWTQPKSAGGTNGMIPMDSALKLLQHAHEHNLPVTAEHFLPIVRRDGSSEPAVSKQAAA